MSPLCNTRSPPETEQQRRLKPRRGVDLVGWWREHVHPEDREGAGEVARTALGRTPLCTAAFWRPTCRSLASRLPPRRLSRRFERCWTGKREGDTYFNGINASPLLRQRLAAENSGDGARKAGKHVLAAQRVG